MKKEYPPTGIQEYLTYEQRCQLIEDIKSVYTKSSYKFIKKLHQRTDDQLYAFRESLREKGKISRYLYGSFKVHMSVLMNKFGFDDYEIGTEWHGKYLDTVFYLGKKSLEPDRLGLKGSTIQLGKIVVNNEWRIKAVHMYGKIIKRYNGLELIL